LRIKHAGEVLLDPAKRAAYDASLLNRNEVPPKHVPFERVCECGKVFVTKTTFYDHQNQWCPQILQKPTFSCGAPTCDKSFGSRQVIFFQQIRVTRTKWYALPGFLCLKLNLIGFEQAC